MRKRIVVLLLLFVCIICSLNAKAYKSLISMDLGGGLESALSNNYGANTTSVVIGLFAYDQYTAESKIVLFSDVQLEVPLKINSETRSELDPKVWINVGLIGGVAYKKSFSSIPLETILGAGIALKEDALVVRTNYGTAGALELSLGLGISVGANYYFSDNFSVMFHLSQQYGILNWGYDPYYDEFVYENGVFRLSSTARVGLGLSLR